MSSRSTKRGRSAPTSEADRAKALRQAGLKSTRPRVAVLGVLEGARSPLSHGEIADELAEEALDQATVYRNLLAMTEVGIVRRTDLGDHVWRFELVRAYAAQGEAHPHLICTGCGTVSCLPDVTVRIEGSGAAALARNGVDVHLRGVCRDCAAGFIAASPAAGRPLRSAHRSPRPSRRGPA